jgi:hypothetical protein
MLFQAAPLVELLIKYQGQPRAINNLAFFPMFTAGVFGQSSASRSSFNSPQQRADMYDFCNSTTYGPCSLVTFNSIDNRAVDGFNWVLSSNYYQVITGACTDTMTTSRAAW